MSCSIVDILGLVLELCINTHMLVFGAPKYQLDPMDSIQRRAARAMAGVADVLGRR